VCAPVCPLRVRRTSNVCRLKLPYPRFVISSVPPEDLRLPAAAGSGQADGKERIWR
jgi:hypothetical protein